MRPLWPSEPTTGRGTWTAWPRGSTPTNAWPACAWGQASRRGNAGAAVPLYAMQEDDDGGPGRNSPSRLYLASAIAMAMMLFGALRHSERAVREEVSPMRVWGAGSASRWDALREWVTAIQDGRLFTRVRAAPDDWPAWRIAERAAMTIAARADPMTAPMAAAVFEGAARTG